MSFSSKTKNELSRIKILNKCCTTAELSSLLRTTGSIKLKGKNKIVIEFTTENAATARRIFRMLKFSYHIHNEVSVKKNNRLKKHNNYIVKIDESNANRVLKDLRLLENDNINLLEFNYGIPKKLVEKDCCKRAYIRGSFLGCGSISDPEKAYHLEFVNHKEKHSLDLVNLINTFGLNAKSIKRKENYITYLKESEQVVDLLNIVGAYNALLEIENIRAIKETRNKINRIINCETANLEKTVNASVRQINNIRIIEKYEGLDKLPENLMQLAKLRLENSEISLKELGEMLDPPLGKSGVNHRFRKIEEIAQRLLIQRGHKHEISKSINKK